MKKKANICKKCGAQITQLVNSKLLGLAGTDKKSWYKQCDKCKNLQKI